MNDCQKTGCRVAFFEASPMLYRVMSWPKNFRAAFTNGFVIKGLSAGVRTTGEPFRSRSMVFCLAGHHPILSMGGNAQRRGLKTSFVPVPALSRSHPSFASWLLNCGLLIISPFFAQLKEKPQNSTFLS
jgi:hypothetical protein